MTRHYQTVPFNPSVSEKDAGKIAAMLGELINNAAKQGWLYQSYESIQITVNPGCLAMFSGPRVVHYGLVVLYQDTV